MGQHDWCGHALPVCLSWLSCMSTSPTPLLTAGLWLLLLVLLFP